MVIGSGSFSPASEYFDFISLSNSFDSIRKAPELV